MNLSLTVNCLYNYQTMPDIIVTCEGIAKLLNLNPNKAASLDENKSRVLKKLAAEIVPILTLFFLNIY